jgi:hypothetical protein
MSIVNAHINSPLTISGCILCLDGNDPNGDGFQIVNGVSLSSWADKSRAGIFSFTQNGALTIRPTYNSSALNGRGGMTFTSSSLQYMSSALSSTNFNFGTMPYTLFYVMTGATGGCFLYRGDAVGTWVNPGKKMWLGNGTSTETSTGLRPSVVGAGQSYCVGATAAANPFILTVIGDTTAPRITFYRNSSSSADTYSINTYAPLSDGTIANIHMGVGPGSAYFNGTICEVLMYNKVLSAQERLTITNMLARKFNIAVS